MRKVLPLATLALVAGTAFAASPASAADSTVTFTAGVTGSTLSIVPSPAIVGVTSGNSVTGLMTSTITDLRPTGGSWTDTISSTDFLLAGATDQTGANRVAATAASIYTTAVTVAIPGTATVANTHTALGSALALSNSGQTLVSATTSNVNTTTLASTVVIDVTGKSTGLYTGTLTQTVA